MRFRPYIVIMGGLTLAVLCAVAGFNLIVDPFRAYALTRWQAVSDYSDSLGTRTARAETLRRGGWNMLIIGSSRAQMGYAPDHPALGGLRAFNAGLPGTNMRELLPVTEFALKHNQPERILLGIDFVLFTAGRSFNDDFELSRFSARRDPISYHLDNTISLRASYASAKTVLFFGLQAPKQFTPFGQTTRHTKDVTRGHRKLFADRLNGFFTNPETYAGFTYSQDRLECFRSIIARLCEQTDDVEVVVNPVHATQLEAIEVAGLWSTFEQWLGDVTQIVEDQRVLEGAHANIRLMSFIAVSPYCDEPIPPAGDRTTTMEFWWESSHFKDELGRYVLDELYGTPPPDRARFGVELTPANIDGVIARLRAERQRWQAENPDEVEFVRSIARKAGLID